MNRGKCLLKNQNLVIASELFYKELKDEAARCDFSICESCTSHYDRTTSLRMHYCLKKLFETITEMKTIMRK